MKVALLICSESLTKRFPNSRDHFAYSSHPGLRITSSKTYQMRPMSYGGRSTFVETPMNSISVYTVETDFATSHPGSVWVWIGLVPNCRASFKPKRKVCSSGYLSSASTSQVRRHPIPMASSDHCYPIAIYRAFL